MNKVRRLVVDKPLSGFEIFDNGPAVTMIQGLIFHWETLACHLSKKFLCPDVLQFLVSIQGLCHYLDRVSNMVLLPPNKVVGHFHNRWHRKCSTVEQGWANFSVPNFRHFIPRSEATRLPHDEAPNDTSGEEFGWYSAEQSSPNHDGNNCTLAHRDRKHTFPGCPAS